MKKISRLRRWFIHLFGGYAEDERELVINCPYGKDCAKSNGGNHD